MEQVKTFEVKIDKNGNVYLNKEILSLLNCTKQNFLKLQINLNSKTATISKKMT